jgi:hypothetical protein
LDALSPEAAAAWLGRDDQIIEADDRCFGNRQPPSHRFVSVPQRRKGRGAEQG